MTPTETVQLVEFVHALCPQQAIDRKTPIAWHPVVKDLDFRAAQNAVIALKHSQKFIDPSEIVQQCQSSAQSHSSSRNLDEALAFANRRELDPAGGSPATLEFLKAKAEMLKRLEERDKAALAEEEDSRYIASPEAQQRAKAWLDGAIRGRQPTELPLAGAAVARWAQLPDDPRELRVWLARKAREEVA